MEQAAARAAEAADSLEIGVAQDDTAARKEKFDTTFAQEYRNVHALMTKEKAARATAAETGLAQARAAETAPGAAATGTPPAAASAAATAVSRRAVAAADSTTRQSTDGGGEAAAATAATAAEVAERSAALIDGGGERAASSIRPCQALGPSQTSNQARREDAQSPSRTRNMWWFGAAVAAVAATAGATALAKRK